MLTSLRNLSELCHAVLVLVKKSEVNRIKAIDLAQFTYNEESHRNSNQEKSNGRWSHEKREKRNPGHENRNGVLIVVEDVEDHAAEDVDPGPSEDAESKIGFHDELIRGRVKKKIDGEK